MRSFGRIALQELLFKHLGLVLDEKVDNGLQVGWDSLESIQCHVIVNVNVLMEFANANLCRIHDYFFSPPRIQPRVVFKNVQLFKPLVVDPVHFACADCSFYYFLPTRTASLSRTFDLMSQPFDVHEEGNVESGRDRQRVPEKDRS